MPCPQSRGGCRECRRLDSRPGGWTSCRRRRNAWADEGAVALEPAALGTERVGEGHGLASDEDFEALGEVAEDVLRGGHERQVFKEVLGIEEGAELLPAVEGRDFPEGFSDEMVRNERFVEGLVVAAQVLGERVRHDFIQVDTDALH